MEMQKYSRSVSKNYHQDEREGLPRPQEEEEENVIAIPPGDESRMEIGEPESAGPAGVSRPGPLSSKRQPKITSVVTVDLPFLRPEKFRRVATREEDDDTDDAASISSDIVVSTRASGTGTLKRKQGRPATSGLGVGLRQRRERETAEARERQKQEMERELNNILDRRAPTKPLPSGDEMAVGEWRDHATPDLTAEILRQVEAVHYVAVHSKTLKGTFVKALKDATATLRAASGSLAIRALAAEHPVATQATSEMAELRRELRALATDNQRLRAELEAVKRVANTGPHPPR